MNILLVSHSGDIGGAGNMLALLAEGLSGDHVLHCVMPSISRGLGDKMIALGVHCHRATLHSFGHPMNPMVEDLVKDHKIDLVITNTVTVSDGAIAASICGIPHIWWVHEILSQDYDLCHLLENGLYDFIKSSGKVVAISDAVEYELGFDCTVIHNAVKPVSKSYPVRSEPVVMTAGGICRRKGQMTLVRASRLVIDEVPEARFVSFGGPWDKEYTDEIRRERAALNISKDKFVFHGFKRDITEEYYKASVFALASTVEPFGLVLIEAMNTGLPVVATRSGGPSEIVRHGIDGYLVDPGDHEQMAYFILDLLRNRDKALMMGINGCTRVEEMFDYDLFMDKWRRVIDAA